MAMTTQSAGEMLSEMNTTPLIDVMLVLLTLLIITLPLQTHATKLTLGSKGPPPIASVDLTVDFDGTVQWNGVPVNGAALDADLAAAARHNPQPAIHIRADRLAKYNAVAHVLSDAQRLGNTNIGLVDMQRY